MSDLDLDLDRLLRMAALRKDDAPPEMPFGFDTRVVALWRAQADAASLGLARLLRRVALTALAVIIVAAAGAYIQADQDRENSEPFANEFAIADSAIQEEIGP
jgi:hypothetical protein